MSVSDLDWDLGGQVPKEDPERESETLPRPYSHTILIDFNRKIKYFYRKMKSPDLETRLAKSQDLRFKGVVASKPLRKPCRKPTFC